MTFWEWLIKYHPETQQKRMKAVLEHSADWPTADFDQVLRHAVGEELYQQWRAYDRITQ